MSRRALLSLCSRSRKQVSQGPSITHLKRKHRVSVAVWIWITVTRRTETGEHSYSVLTCSKTGPSWQSLFCFVLFFYRHRHSVAFRCSNSSMNPFRAKQMLLLMQLVQRVDSQRGPPTRNVHFLEFGFSQSVHKKSGIRRDVH